jgi:ribonuclease HI
LFNWINNFLQDRTIQVRIGSTLSDEVGVENGVPQGSAISPILFLIAINDLCPPGVNFSIFADDTAMWKSGRNVEKLQKVMQKALNYVEEWCNKWGFKVSIAKTSFVLFQRGRIKPVSLLYEGKVLKREKVVKFLGLMFDQRLSWKDHIKYLVDKCRKRINILKAISGSKWGADKATMLIVYKSLILSCIDYGCEVYDSACKTTKELLTRVQSQCLRICSGALKCTSIAALQVECGEMPLDLRRNMKQVQSALKYKAFPDHTAAGCYQSSVFTRHGRYNEHFCPIQNKVSEIVGKMPSCHEEKVAAGVPSWEFNLPDINLELKEHISKKFDHPMYMYSRALEHMTRWKQYMHVYTDGSKKDDRTGCAFYIPGMKFGSGIRISDGSSVFEAELVAILKVLEFLYQKPPLRCVIFSDSLSGLQALSDDSDHVLVKEISNYFFLFANIGSVVELCWIPSHTGIQGNEEVDRLAKLSLESEVVQFSVSPSYRDLFPLVEKLFLDTWQTRWNEETKGRFYFQVEPHVSTKVKYKDQNKSKQTAITRLRLGKCLLNDVLHLYKKHDTGLCDTCLLKEDVTHYLLDCIEYDKWQEPIINKMINKGLTINIHTLLSNQNMYNDIWLYILNTNRQL